MQVTHTPAVHEIVELIAAAAAETEPEEIVLRTLQVQGITPPAHEWLEAILTWRESEDIEDGCTDVLTLVDDGVHVWDRDGLRRDEVERRRSDVAHLAASWILSAETERATEIHYGVRWPDGRIIHRWTDRDKAEQLQHQTAGEGTELVRREVAIVRYPWRVVRNVARDRGAA